MTDCCFTDVRNISIVRQISGHHKPSSQRNPWRVGVLDFQRTDLVPPQCGGFLWSKDHRFRVYGCPEDMGLLIAVSYGAQNHSFRVYGCQEDMSKATLDFTEH
jgi:hypothetical protein